jgi:vomeronasal 2 receptor
VFSSVEDSPVYLLRIPFGKECGLTFFIKKLENLPVGPGIVPPMTRVDIVPAETAQLYLHGDRCRPAGGKMVKSAF